jgi:hypothetical protein
MKINPPRTRLTQLAFCISLALGATSLYAQNTTSAIAGRITSGDGKPIAGASVRILHIESGSASDVTTDGEGRYSVRGLRSGGPFTVTITGKDGAKEVRENVFLNLAETATLDARLGAAVAVEKVTVTGAAGSDRFSNTAMGATTALTRQELDAFGSINRNLQDYARTDARLSQTDKERGEISAAGQNSRFNTVTIDGVATNDTFGLESNNLPTAKQPISIDAIQAVQVNVSNYDTTQKGYTGANINAVTRSGTNKFKGSVYYVYRDNDTVGQRFNRATDSYFDAPKFEETTVGVSLGGPIIKDKLFFFANYEELASTRLAPAFGPIGVGGVTNVGITQSAITGAQEIARTRYNYDIGSSAIPDGTELTVKDAMLKVDWNILTGHRASFRYSKTDQSEPIFPGLNATGVSLNSHWYSQKKLLETFVGQWFADWSPNFSTELKLSQRNYESDPQNNSNRPLVGLQFAGALPTGVTGVATGNRFLNFGTERSRHFNSLATETFDGYFGANWLRGDHEIKFGGDYSNNEIFNAFLQDTKGNYTFGCVNSSATYTYTFGAITCATATAAQVEQAVLENFSRGRPLSYQVQLPVDGVTLDSAAARFSLKNYGVFAQDTWNVTPNLTLMFGLRLDTPEVKERPRANAAAAQPVIPGVVATGVRQTGGFGLDNTQTIDGQELFQPRFGFNYTFASKRPMQLRGGFGLFQGAAANVWLSNPFSNTGVSTRIIGCGTLGFAACPATGNVFSADPLTQPSNFTGANPAANVDYLAPGLGQPSVWKANLAFETELPFGGLVASAEYLYTQTKEGIFYKHLNLGDPTRTGIDGRSLFYTAQAYNPACWTATGGTVTTGACAGFRARALSNASYNNVLLADKTDLGGGHLVTLGLQRPMTKGFGWQVSYTYTTAKEVSPLTSSVANSNWASRAVFNPNEEVQANSAYLVRDRFNVALNFQRAFFGRYKTTLGLFYEGRKGKPYSWTFNNDMNGDGLAGNDLLFIPRDRNSNQVVFVGDTATSRTNEDRFWEIVGSNEVLSNARGAVVSRNSDFAPWTNSIDGRISQELPGFFKEHKSVISLDLFNIGNMLNKKWGRINEIGFQANGGQARSFVNYAGIDAQGRYVYAMMPGVEDFVTRQERGESQWAVQLTLRYEF